MQDKLQELTDRLYNEGLSKGKKDGEAFLLKAQQEAAQIIADAKEEAERILSQANKEAEETRTMVKADVKMATMQGLAATKQEIEKMIITKAAQHGVKSNFNSADFVKALITDVVKAFNPQNAAPVDLDLILPSSLKAEIEPFLKNEVAQQVGTGITVNYTKKINGGFKVAPKDGGYLIQFTDEEFIQLIANYLRPATKKILFG